MGPKKKQESAKYKTKYKNKIVSNNQTSVKASVAKEDSPGSSKAEITINELSSKPPPIATTAENNESKKYAKRRIESNWQRYEIDEHDGASVSEAISIDNVLKGRYGGVSNQFRFSDEKEWEEESFTDDSISEFYSLDLRDLAISLACLPLFKRLDIEEKYFELDMLKVMEHEAQNNLSKHQGLQNCKDETPFYMKSGYKNADMKSANYDVKFLTAEEANSDLELLKQTSEKFSEHVRIPADDFSDLPSSTKPLTVQDLPDESIDELEFELDALLSLSKPTEMKSFKR